jgi:hypothetical protein
MFKHFFVLLTALAMGSCSNQSYSDDAAATNQAKVERVSCQSDLPFTEKKLGNIKVKLFEPNDPTKPDTWQGPVCFNVNGAECGLDISLIKGVELSGDGHVIVNAFSGSVAHIYTIDPVNCTILDYKKR